jgi:polyisoprenoid-binding protein YceI
MPRIIVISLLMLSLFSCREKDSKRRSEETPQPILIKTDPSELIGNDFLIDDVHSYVGFKIKYFGNSPVRGRFDEFDGTLFYDEKDVRSLSASVFVGINSINTGNERRDNDLIDEGGWFDGVNFPTMSFVSDSVISVGHNGFDMAGVLTIKGVSKDVKISFESPTNLTRDWAKNKQIDFSGSLVINRQDYGIEGGDFWSSVMENGLTQLSDEVEIELDIHCRRADYLARYDDTDSTENDRRIMDRIANSGIGSGLAMIDSLSLKDGISAGEISSIGYTMNAWELYDEAKSVFEKRMALFPEKTSTYNQLGITSLLLKDNTGAKDYFNTAYAADSTDSRAFEYLRLIETISEE